MTKLRYHKEICINCNCLLFLQNLEPTPMRCSMLFPNSPAQTGHLHGPGETAPTGRPGISLQVGTAGSYATIWGAGHANAVAQTPQVFLQVLYLLLHPLLEHKCSDLDCSPNGLTQSQVSRRWIDLPSHAYLHTAGSSRHSTAACDGVED